MHVSLLAPAKDSMSEHNRYDARVHASCFEAPIALCSRPVNQVARPTLPAVSSLNSHSLITGHCPELDFLAEYNTTALKGRADRRQSSRRQSTGPDSRHIYRLSIGCFKLTHLHGQTRRLPRSFLCFMFDLVVVGEGGGPDETNLSAYLLKPSAAAWEDGIVALEAGSGQGALQKLLQGDPQLFNSPDQPLARTKPYSASEIYSLVRCFLISHAHLDHINSLVISAGSLGGPRKRLCAAKQTLADLESVFADRIWPRLASWNSADDDDHKLLYIALGMNDAYETLIPNVSVCGFPVSHGHNEAGNYDSSAFFIRYDPSGHEFLFFGDLEPDALSLSPQTINVWRAAAPKIPASLSTIFIECSWPSSRSDDMLYGHLKPEHLVTELEVLAREIIKVRNASSSTRPARKKQRMNPNASPPIDVRGALEGLRVFVIHCKDTLDGAPDRPNQTLIIEQIKTLVEVKGLGVEILAARQGMRIQI